MSMTSKYSTATAASLNRPFQMLIGGAWVNAESGETLETRNPADGSVITTIPAGDKADIDRAVAAARQALEHASWAGMTPGVRARILWRVAELIEQHAEVFAELETLDNGKPIRASRTLDVPGAAAYFRYWSGWCTKISGQTPALDLPGEFMAMTVREPVGVVGLITPWNYPLLSAASKLGPALAAGCTVVLKPAEQTSLTALRLGELLLEAGLPDGVANIVSGLGIRAGAALAEHPDVDKISFTGSTAVGKSLLVASQGNLKRLTLELGGKSPTIILPDADLDRAIAGAANAIFRNAGQVCAAGSRLYVARHQFEQVVNGIISLAGEYKIGPGMDPETTLGPLVSEKQRDRVLGYVDDAREAGALILSGGRARGESGYFVEPTVIGRVTPDMKIVQEEVFGPVLTVTPVDDLEDLAALANNTIYGLSASIWTRDISSAYRLARRIRAGTITINSGNVGGPNIPFGGFKQSGWGRENGVPGIENFTELKTVISAL